ncbi:MAG: putative sugar O-methyltransferase [Nocardioides sp.]|uniref:putative sugar O-methyltransferase n=1 Tax=Nocardioides sp. TaxID=35761 RepID=UPI003D6B3BCF
MVFNRLRTKSASAEEPAPAEEPAGSADPEATVADASVGHPDDDPRWARLTSRALGELAEAPEIYRPTSFWGPGLDQLLKDMREGGLANFKRWPTAPFWFLPRYGSVFTQATLGKVMAKIHEVHPNAKEHFVKPALFGVHHAMRDIDAARLAWNHSAWPTDLAERGESSIGNANQAFSLVPEDPSVKFGKAYLNYMLVMTALSRHIDAPPKSVLEIGGGAGHLGEFLMSRDPQVRYVDVDLPPLVTVASYYLTELFGDRVLTYDDRIASTGPIDVPKSAVLPNWRLGDLQGPFDVAVNCFSFQEMEPDVVEHYAARISDLDAEYVVSYNSRAGKRKATEDNKIGVIVPVTSDRIVKMFESHGYELLETYGRPLVHSAANLVVMRRPR